MGFIFVKGSVASREFLHAVRFRAVGLRAVGLLAVGLRAAAGDWG